MDDLGDFHKAVAACVFIKYISLSSATPAFKVKDLCFWAQKMIEVGLEHIQAGLSSVNVSLEQTDDGVFQFMCSELPVVDLTKLGADVAESQRETIESFVAKGPDEGLRRIVDNITGHIATLFQRHAPENARFVDMSDIAVVHPGELWTEEWAAMYMCCWQASGAEKSLLCPPVHVWEDHHFAWRNQKEATKRTHTEILMGEYMACFLIPCHEVIHIAQHIAGLTDSDPTSYSAEHDASRLNMPLLLLVLQEDCGIPAWFVPVLIMQAINSALLVEMAMSALPDAPVIMAAYRSWADSFGLESPNAAFGPILEKCTEEDRTALAMELESYFKTLVTAEALGAAGLAKPCSDAAHFQELLGAAFHPARTGDVYSEANRAVCIISDSPLALGEAAWRRVSGPWS